MCAENDVGDEVTTRERRWEHMRGRPGGTLLSLNGLLAGRPRLQRLLSDSDTVVYTPVSIGVQAEDLRPIPCHPIQFYFCMGDVIGASEDADAAMYGCGASFKSENASSVV